MKVGRERERDGKIWKKEKNKIKKKDGKKEKASNIYSYRVSPKAYLQRMECLQYYDNITSPKAAAYNLC